MPHKVQPMLVALLGLCSALLTSAFEFLEVRLEWEVFVQLAPPLIFGGVLAAYFRGREQRVSVWRAAVFVALCIAAYFISMLLAVRLFLAFLRVHGTNSVRIPFGVSFAAGFVGAFIVLGAGLFLFGPGNVDWQSIARLFGCALVGGVLGIPGLRAYEYFQSRFLLFAVWETGVALCLGFMLSREQPDADGSLSDLQGG